MDIFTNAIKDIINFFIMILRLDHFYNYIFELILLPVQIFISKNIFIITILFIVLWSLGLKNIVKRVDKKLKIPSFIFKWHKKGEYHFHVVKNIYQYGGGTHERKYDRESLGIEEQIFQQCVPSKLLVNL